MSKKKKIIYVCRCFSIPEADINKALEAGCSSLHQILDFTGAGSGPCGGSCRTKINALLENYLEKKQLANTELATIENTEAKNAETNAETKVNVEIDTNKDASITIVKKAH